MGGCSLEMPEGDVDVCGRPCVPHLGRMRPGDRIDLPVSPNRMGYDIVPVAWDWFVALRNSGGLNTAGELEVNPAIFEIKYFHVHDPGFLRNLELTYFLRKPKDQTYCDR